MKVVMKSMVFKVLKLEYIGASGGQPVLLVQRPASKLWPLFLRTGSNRESTQPGRYAVPCLRQEHGRCLIVSPISSSWDYNTCTKLDCVRSGDIFDSFEQQLSVLEPVFPFPSLSRLLAVFTGSCWPLEEFLHQV